MQPNKITIHCSDTYANQHCDAAIIDKWHRERGWNGIGYHYVITRSGHVEIGRSVKRMGAHVKGHNQNNIGICLCGGKGFDGSPEDNFTAPQMRALRNLIVVLRAFYEITDVKGHNEYTDKKTCPNFNVREFYESI